MTDRYIGTKEVTAYTVEKDGKPGYGVIYADGYTSWSPKEAFEDSYRVTEGDSQALTFSDALYFLKRGRKVSRTGWNAPGQWVTLIHPGNAMHLGYDMQPCIGIKTAGGKMQPGWVPSQSDMLAEDWVMVVV